MQLTTRYLVILLTLLISSAPGFKLFASKGEPLHATGEGALHQIDFSNFRGENDKAYVEFYIQIAYQNLQFIKTDGKFKASYDFELAILNDEGNIVDHQTIRDPFEVDNFKSTYITNKARISSMAFLLEPGEYTLVTKATDLETNAFSEIHTTFEAADFKTTDLSISDIQFSQNIYPAEEGLPYVKNQRYVEPNAVRLFSHGIADIFLYFEIYNLNANDEIPKGYLAQFIIHDEAGKIYTQLNRRHQKPGESAAHSIKLPVDYFSSGEYSLTVKITDEGSNQITETTSKFKVIDESISLNEIDNTKYPF